MVNALSVIEKILSQITLGNNVKIKTLKVNNLCFNSIKLSPIGNTTTSKKEIQEHFLPRNIGNQVI